VTSNARRLAGKVMTLISALTERERLADCPWQSYVVVVLLTGTITAMHQSTGGSPLAETSTIFKVRLLAKSRPDLQEGFLELWKHEGAIVQSQKVAFDHLDAIPGKIRRMLKAEGIEWPRKK
jgi:hypothetical protein